VVVRVDEMHPINKFCRFSGNCCTSCGSGDSHLSKSRGLCTDVPGGDDRDMESAASSRYMY
jgi:hypothetical protein